MQAVFALGVGLAQAFDGATPSLSLRRPETLAFAGPAAASLFAGAPARPLLPYARVAEETKPKPNSLTSVANDTPEIHPGKTADGKCALAAPVKTARVPSASR